MYASTWKDWKGINDTFKEHMFWPLSRNAVTSFGDHGKQNILHQNTPQQQRVYSLSCKGLVLHEEGHL
jgi:hypothetical protein